MEKKRSSGKSDLSLVQTSRYVHIPNLKEKLELLYGSHPSIRTLTELAGELGVSKGTLSTWVTGKKKKAGQPIDPVNPNSIRATHYRHFVKIFGLPEDVIQLEDFAEFRNRLATFEAGRGPWEKLVAMASEDEKGIEIIPDITRGAYNPDDDDPSGILRLAVGDRFMIRVPNPGLAHAIMLLQDRAGWASLRPTLRFKDTSVGSEMVVPRRAADGLDRLVVDPVGGVHKLLAVFLDDPLPPDVLSTILARPMDADGLNHAARLFHARLAAGADKCQMLSRRFLVTA
jgi:hypothetical protein